MQAAFDPKWDSGVPFTIVFAPDGKHFYVSIGSHGNVAEEPEPGPRRRRQEGETRADERAIVEFHRVPYDFRKAQMRILRAGLPDRLATRLREGR